MRADRYDTPWRPNFEGGACAAWLLGAAVTGLMISRMSYVSPPYPWTLGLCLALALRWAWPASRIRRRKRRLTAFDSLWFMPLGELRGHLDPAGRRIYLGRGFEWGPRHAQAAYEVLKLGIEHLVRMSEDRLGATWIHGLDLCEHAIGMPIEHTRGHTLIVGTTRAGKTRLFDLLVTQAVLRDEAVIVIDPKGDRDLRETARRACAMVGEPGRFIYFHPAFPQESAAIDPLRHFNRETELASRVAELIPSETGADPFKSFGQMALANIVQGLILVGDRVTLLKLRHHLDAGPDELVGAVITAHAGECLPNWREAIEKYARSPRRGETRTGALARCYGERLRDIKSSVVVEGLINMYEHERAHFGKMIASLMPVLNMLTSGELGPLLSPDDDHKERDLDMSEVIKRGRVAYIGLDSLTDGMVGAALGSIVLADLAAVAGDRYNYAVGDRPVNVFIDEAAEVISDPMIQLLNKGAGAGLRVAVATQTFADFAARTGSEAKARQVLGNMNNLVVMRVLDGETQAYIADNLPMTKVQFLMRTQGASTDSNHPMLFTGSHGERLMEEESSLFPAALLGELPDLHYIAKLSGGRIVKGRLPILGEKK